MIWNFSSFHPRVRDSPWPKILYLSGAGDLPHNSLMTIVTQEGINMYSYLAIDSTPADGLRIASLIGKPWSHYDMFCPVNMQSSLSTATFLREPAYPSRPEAVPISYRRKSFYSHKQRSLNVAVRLCS